MGFNRSNTVTERKFVGSNIWKTNLLKDIGLDIPGHFLVLHDFSDLWMTSEDEADNGNLAIHFVKGELKTPICNHLYFEDDDESSFCRFCEMPGKYSANNDPILVKPMLVYNLTIGENTYKPKSDGSGDYKVNPLQILEISAGSKGKNFEQLKFYHNEGALNGFKNPDSILEVTKLEKGISQPKFLTPLEIKALKKGMDLEIPKAVREKYENIPASQLMGILLDVYGNVKREDPLFTSLGVEWPEPPETKETDEESTGETKTDDTLDR